MAWLPTQPSSMSSPGSDRLKRLITWGTSLEGNLFLFSSSHCCVFFWHDPGIKKSIYTQRQGKVVVLITLSSLVATMAVKLFKAVTFWRSFLSCSFCIIHQHITWRHISYRQTGPYYHAGCRCPGGRLNIKMSFYQYRLPHVNDKMV